ncbi:MAG: bifunctional folylpolyglutamate synthase/dihydrofolate synthase [Ignavibacteriae bacterium]|nr:bifunctional folylpolyglutamate synthase/dihydrofolate synthase [Ignavibacteriota bacterium]
MIKFTSYAKCIKFLFGLERAEIKYDLKNIRALLKSCGNPERKFKSIHIAGTNGKGSVASMVYSVLTESGINAGLYTSPHITDFRERILINGEMISRKFVMDFTNRNLRLIEKIKPSFFEVNTAMAFEYFAEKEVDIAVIEAGLGGRLDSTNVIKPVVSVITGIAIDHTEYLGNTIESIASEKAGIIKKKIPCIAGLMEKKALNVIKRKCGKDSSKFYYAENLWNIKRKKITDEYTEYRVSRKRQGSEIINIEFPVSGKYQQYNIKTAFTALDIIGIEAGITFSEDNIQSGIRNIKINSKFFGRFQKVSDSPGTVIDVSHNVQGIKNIRENLKSCRYNKLYIIFGMMKDKEYEKCIRELEKLDAEIILTKPGYKRAEEPEVLFSKAGKKEKFSISENIKAAVKYLEKNAGKGDMILITGSFYLVSDFVKLKSIHL